MYIKNTYFRVDISHFAERHFCKAFLKKYKQNWIPTKQMIECNLQRAYMVFTETRLIDMLAYSVDAGIGIFKLDFRVAGTDESPKSSGNRVIFALSNMTEEIEVLLVYSKDHCHKKQSETQWIFEHIKKNSPRYKKLCFTQ